MVLLPTVQVGTVDHQVAAAYTQGEEGLSDGRHDGLGVQAGEVREQVELDTGVRSGQKNGTDGQENDHDKHDGQQDVAHLFDAALDAPYHDKGGEQQHNAQPQDHLEGIGGEIAEHGADLLGIHAAVCAGDRLDDVRDGPAGNAAVEGERQNQGNDAQNTDQIPFLSGQQLFQGGGIAGAGFTANGELRDEYGDGYQKQSDQRDNDKGCAAVTADQIGKFPNDAQTDGAAHGGENKGNAASELFAFGGWQRLIRLGHFVPPILYASVRGSRRPVAWEQDSI